MAKHYPKPPQQSKTQRIVLASPSSRQAVPSLLDAMQDGCEYQSIVGAMPDVGVDLLDDIIRSITDIEAVRGRPCIAYIGNVVRPGATNSGIDSTDDLPFSEMVSRIPSHVRAIDLLLVTNGGLGQQVVRFVNSLRPRFDDVGILLPSVCMSAGTLLTLSGDSIWMAERACLGPIDPQVPTRDGRYVPAQALVMLVEKLQKDGQQALSLGNSVPWTAVRIIDTIDKKELGDAITATNYLTAC